MIKGAKMIQPQDNILTIRGELKIMCQKNAKYTPFERPQG